MHSGNEDVSNKKAKMVAVAASDDTHHTNAKKTDSGDIVEVENNLEEVRPSSDSDFIRNDDSEDDTDDRTVPYYESSSSEDAGKNN